MKVKLYQIIIVLLIISSYSNQEVNSIENNASNHKKEKPNTTESNLESDKEFKFNYVYAGLGSGMGNKGPRFRITGNNFIYTKQQNSSWTGEYNKSIDTICQGKIRKSSIDSIKEITNGITELRIYETNPNVMSGGIVNIIISYNQKRIEFTLHNASHPKAKEIIEIVDSNIPKKHNKLYLWKDWDESDSERIEWKLPDEIKEEKK
jgi:flagellar basal body rod protein FlgC